MAAIRAILQSFGLKSTLNVLQERTCFPYLEFYSSLEAHEAALMTGKEIHLHIENTGIVLFNSQGFMNLRQKMSL